MGKIITLLTDFGSKDLYVGCMKGAILSVAPDVTIVDLTHEVSPQDVPMGAFLLQASVRFFPRGTIHVAVVDPGVGSSRRILAAHCEGQIVLAPDNGLLTPLLPRVDAIHHVSEPRFFRDEVSRTFHGRDIFAPVAGHLALGVTIQELGPEVSDALKIDWPTPVRKGDEVTGEILFFDRFGSAITNIAETDLPQGAVCVRFGERDLGPLRASYCDVNKGQALAIIGSFGHLELAVREGSFLEGYAHAGGRADVKVVVN
jgi:S-adenosylmethionine hydrolase